MISAVKLSVSFGASPLFEDASFVVNDRDRIALVGKNGAGKSTLLRVLCGQQQPTGGSVNVPAGMRFGYLPQVMHLADQTTVRQEVWQAFNDVLQLKRNIRNIEQQLSERTDYDTVDYLQLTQQLVTAQDHLHIIGGENCDAEIERTLTGLGFHPSDFDRLTSEFSGGWRMRIELAKILLSRPDILLLDEPTNHLDIESITWLESFLNTCRAAVIIVSHDRAFVNNVTTRTLEISCGKIIDYRVKYDEYCILRKERREQQLRAYENQQREIADMRTFIERFRYQATKAIQVQQKIKQLEKIVPIEIDEVDNTSMRLKFPLCLRSGDYPVICDEVSKAYGDHQVFSHVNLTIKRGEKVAFAGRNGEGKSTLVKCIMGEIPFDGQLKIGHNVRIGYFAQNQAQLLDEELTIYDTIDQVATGEMRLRIRDLLGAFMFGGEVSDKKVKVLSGGERSRLAMIKLLLQPVNLLILDEPTNHLDMVSKEVLKNAILAFDGTAIIVSHDREFLDGLVSKVYAFSNGQVREHIGGIYDWLQKTSPKEQPLLSHPEQRKNQPHATTIPPNISQGEEKPTARNPLSFGEGRGGVVLSGAALYAARKEQQRRISQLSKNVRQTENLITELEERIAELNAQLSLPENAANLELVNQYTAVQQQLDQETEKWLQLSEELSAASDETA